MPDGTDAAWPSMGGSEPGMSQLRYFTGQIILGYIAKHGLMSTDSSSDSDVADRAVELAQAVVDALDAV